MAQFGGLKLKNPNKLGFQAVYDMLDNPRSTLTLLTHESLKGFLFVLNVHENDSEYFALHKGKFVSKVTSYIFKIVLITTRSNKTLKPFVSKDGKSIDKESESKQSYFNEAKLQQHVWKKSISRGREAICPPVANFSLFNYSNSQKFINFLRVKVTNLIEVEVAEYLMNNVNRSTTIGAILMPNIQQSVTVKKFLRSSKFNGRPKLKKEEDFIRAKLAAQVVRLFIEVGVIHLDLHLGNALVYEENGLVNCLMIDFGSASDIMNGDEDELTLNEKKGMIRHKNDFFDRFLHLNGKTRLTDDAKNQFMIDVLDNIKDTDQRINQRNFAKSYNDVTKYQMFWYEDIKKTRLLIMAYNILAEYTVNTTPNVILLNRLIKTGFLIDFSKNISYFDNIDFPSESREALGRTFPSESRTRKVGGRKNKRKSKKIRGLPVTR